MSCIEVSDDVQLMRIGAFRHLVGGVAEWTNATVLKTVIPSRVSRVRIPSPPPELGTKSMVSGFWWVFPQVLNNVFDPNFDPNSSHI